MKRQLLGISLLTLGLFTGISFGQTNSYPDCSPNGQGGFYCSEFQSCNNPNDVCMCTANSKVIPHNSTCIPNGSFLKDHVVTSYAVSGSSFSFKVKVQNNYGDKKFTLKLPTIGNAKIRIINADPAGLLNSQSVNLYNADPIYTIISEQTREITIQGVIQTSSYSFGSFDIVSYLYTNSPTNPADRIDMRLITIYPTANYGIEQRVVEPFPLNSGDNINYEVVIRNSGTTPYAGISLTSLLSSLLVSPSIEGVSAYSSQSNLGYVWSQLVTSINPGEAKTFKLKAALKETPLAGTKITTTSSISGGREIISEDNSVTTTYTIPTLLDLSLDSADKTTLDPEDAGDILGFRINYKNIGNTGTQSITLNAIISGTNQNITTFTLPSLAPNATGSFVVTGHLDKKFDFGTKFCLSGNINTANEIGSTGNNQISNICYTFVKSADLTIKASLVNELHTINAGTTLQYKIEVTNSGEKAAENISFNIYPSRNQTPPASQPASISLTGGETKSFFYTTILKTYRPTGDSVSLNGSVIFTGKELDTTNNSFALNYALPGLSDVFVEHSMNPFNGYKKGDTVSYVVRYGNSGFANAVATNLAFVAPSSITVSQAVTIPTTLKAGEKGELVINGTLNQNLAVGANFSSEARVSTTSAQTTTGNDVSSISHTITGINNIQFSIAAQNKTRFFSSFNPILAVSGDIISFTINYINNGNVPAENVSILFSYSPYLALDPFTANIGTLGPDQQGTITITGHISAKNFVSISPVITISSSISTTSNTITIQEPNLCGDGLITREEMCDPTGPVNVGPGQECDACILVTTSIANIACVQFGTQQICSTPAIIPLAKPECKDLTVSTPNGNSVTATCLGFATRTNTPIKINCGYGQTYSGVASPSGIFSSTCTYTSPEQANLARVSCMVGASTCNAGAGSCTVNPEQKVVIFDKDENEGKVKVNCSVNNNQQSSLQIKCGNNNYSDTIQGTSMEYTCKYRESDFEEEIKNITCLVNGVEACESDIILDEGFVGICGNGKREGFEQCDGGEQYGEGTRNGQQCKKGCTLNNAAGACLSIGNGNISVQNNEIMPFWWRINDTKNITSNSCNENNENDIRESSMKCSFSIKQPGKDSKTILETDCNAKALNNKELFKNFYPTLWSQAFGNYYVDLNMLSSSSKFDENILGEHKIRLDKVDYEYCSCNGNDCRWKNTELQNICETNFTITKPYIVQKSAFGITPKATNIDLKKFFDINGDSLINKTDLSKVIVLDSNSYAGSDVVNPMVDNFVYRMEKLAVKIANNKLPASLRDVSATVSKVPNKDIYIIKGSNKTIPLKPASFTKPFTLIIKDADIVINGDINVNGMFIAQNGTISFNEPVDSDCSKPQTAKGIFIAKNFNATKVVNNSLNKQWCNAGGLHIKGIIMGGDIKNLVLNKRSSLNNWFNVNGSENTIKTNRRNQIFNGASVLIEYSPELWQTLPPGADEFTKALDIYKK